MARHIESKRNAMKEQAAEAPLEIDIPRQGLLQTTWRRRWSVLLAVAVSLSAALAYLVNATPLYTSTSRLYVEQSGPKIISEQAGVMTQSKNYLYTQAELLKSTPILASVVDGAAVRDAKTFEHVDNPIGYLKKELDIGVGKKDDIIAVSLDSPYPEEAAQVVNAIVDSYITHQAATRESTADKVLKILQREKARREKELSQHLQKKLEFIKANGVLSLDSERGNIILDRLSRLSYALTEAQLETISSKADYETVEGMMGDPAGIRQFAEAQQATRVYISLADEESQLRADLKRLQAQREALRRECTNDHPSVWAIQQRIAEVEQQLGEQEERFAKAYLEVARRRWVTAKQKEEELEATLAAQQEAAQELNTKVAEFEVLESEAKRTEQLCDIIDSRIKELNITEDVGALNVTILEVARAEDKPTRPQRARIMAMALVLGLMLGVGLALTLDWMDTRLRSADEISAVLGVAVLGTVPSMRGKESMARRGRKVDLEPTSAAAEAYRTIRTAVYFGVPDGQAKTLLVTSPAPGDGKTTLVSNLAIAMAQAGQRTLVIDCDFRNPRQHEVFELKHDEGLSSVLAGQELLDEAMQKTGTAGLDVLNCGPIPPNPSEMLNSDAFANIVRELSEKYDRIVIDSPPIMAVADARILGAMCDVTLMVLRAEKSTRKASEQARDGLLSVGAHILGAVVNDVHYGEGGYGYYGGYGYGYGRTRGDSEKTGRGESGKGELVSSADSGSTHT